MCLLEKYGSRLFLHEIMNACAQTNTEFFVAPYLATPQIVYLFKEQMVHSVAGSVMCLLFDSAPSLNQVIIDFDFENGFFSYVDQDDILTAFSPNKSLS
jgi:hypothetical protein